MASLLSNGRCYSHVADEIATLREDLFRLKFLDKHNIRIIIVVIITKIMLVINCKDIFSN